MRVSGSMWLSNSWKQEIDITEDGVIGEVIEGLRRTKMTLPYDRIAQVNLHRGVFAATLEVINKGGAGNLVVKGLAKDEAEQAKSLIEERIRPTAEGAPGAQVGENSLVSELQQLAYMHGRGILSDAEFQSAKARLLVNQNAGSHH